jgi:hypothetical protein
MLAEDLQAVPDVERLEPAAELKRPRLVAFLFADWAQQGTDQKIALGGIFERLTLRGKQTPAFFLFIRATEVYEFTPRVLIYGPDGAPLGEIVTAPTGGFAPSHSEPNYSQVIVRVAMEMPQPGVYWFELRAGEAVFPAVPLLVLRQEEAEDADTNDTPS